MRGLCVRCKGVRLLCGRPKCPILEKYKHIRKLRVKETVFGASPPGVLVGSKLWPEVTVGPLVSEDERAPLCADPSKWTGMNIDEIVGMLSTLYRSTFRLHVRKATKPHRLLEITQDIALSSREVEVEVYFEKAPKPVLKFDGILAPMGPSGRIRSIRAGNPKIPRYVYRVVEADDMRASEAIWDLYSRGESTYYLARLLSVGLLGIPKDRLLVPTRWSITAVDSTLSRKLAREILHYPEIGEIRLFRGKYAGNKYRVLLVPGPLAYELIEIWLPGSVWNPQVAAGAWIGSDYEYEYWRTHPFSRLGGGYYAMKFPVYEYLRRIRRRAAVLALREVTPEYWAPLGSWQMRETLRKMFGGKYEKFDDLREALAEMQKGLVTPIEEWLRKSKLVADLLGQRKLVEFL